MKKFTFYLLNLTWGLPLNIVGFLVAAVLLIAGKKPQKWGYCYYFEVGDNWGGLELGIFFLCSKNVGAQTKNHEHGHAIQNCYWGVLFPFVIWIPSAFRYWYRELIYYRRGKRPSTMYDDIWFEGQATRWGTALVNRIKEQKNEAE